MISQSIADEIQFVQDQPGHSVQYGLFLTRVAPASQPSPAERYGYLERYTLGGLPYLRVTAAGDAALSEFHSIREQRAQEEVRYADGQQMEQKRHRENLRVSWLQFWINFLVTVLTFIIGMVVDRQTGFIDSLIHFFSRLF
ncbi:MAG: hypothetical protein IJ240_04130 [Clostridia bacterium]|nr:hypothetical protein [Clostridia bacterium]